MPEGSFVSVDQNVSEIRRHTDWDDWGSDRSRRFLAEITSRICFFYKAVGR
jgi:hypothetical protein